MCEVQSGAKQFAHSVCQSIIKELHFFQLNFVFLTLQNINQNMSQNTNMQFSGTFVLNLANCTESHPDHTCAQRGKAIISVCLPGSQTKLKIIPNRKLTVFKDVIMDTNNRHT